MLGKRGARCSTPEMERYNIASFASRLSAILNGFSNFISATLLITLATVRFIVHEKLSGSRKRSGRQKQGRL